MNDGRNSSNKVGSIKFAGGFGDDGTVESGLVKLTDGGSKGVGSLLGKSEAILPYFDKVGAATFGEGDNWAAGSKGFNGSDAKRFEAGEKVGFGAMEVLCKFGGGNPREEFD